MSILSNIDIVGYSEPAKLYSAKLQIVYPKFPKTLKQKQAY